MESECPECGKPTNGIGGYCNYCDEEEEAKQPPEWFNKQQKERIERGEKPMCYSPCKLIPVIPMTTLQNKEIEEEYIVTIRQLDAIVDYCVNMTVGGSNSRKDWTRNVQEALGLIGQRTTSKPQIKLKAKDTALEKQANDESIVLQFAIEDDKAADLQNGKYCSVGDVYIKVETHEELLKKQREGIIRVAVELYDDQYDPFHNEPPKEWEKLLRSNLTPHKDETE